jgi:hypothetical protein
VVDGASSPTVVRPAASLPQIVKPEIQFRVLPAYYELAGKVAGAINQAINQGQSELLSQ